MRWFPLFFAIMAFCLQAEAEIPIGFKEAKLGHSESSLLIPQEWKTKTSSGDNVDIYLFSPQVNDDDFNYDMGLLVMVYKGIRVNTGANPSDVARDIQSWVTNAKGGTMVDGGPKEVGPFRGAVAIHESDSHRFHEMHLGVDESDRLWMIAFGSPKETWQTNWDLYGQVIFKNIRLDDKY